MWIANCKQPITECSPIFDSSNQFTCLQSLLKKNFRILSPSKTEPPLSLPNKTELE